MIRLKLASLLLIFSMALTAALPAFAQDDDIPGFGEGGPVVSYYAGTDPATFNPLYYSDGTSGSIISNLYPALITIDVETGLAAPNQPGALAESWEYNEDGTVLTINLREGLEWSDGTPITANDYKYATDAIRSGEINSPRQTMFTTLADGTPAGGNIESIEVIDDYTLEITFAVADCVSFDDVNNAIPVPAHHFEELYGDNYAAMLDDPRRIPEVTFGAFYDLEFIPGDRASFLPNPDYPDTTSDYVIPSEYIMLSVPDTTIATERFLEGEFTLLAVPSARQEEVENNPDFQTYRFTGNSFSYFAFNHADPTNPQPGLDAEGNPIDQGIHPIFGDVRVRRAIAHAYDMESVIDGIFDGNAVDIGTHTTPNSWVYDPELVYEYNPELALELLAEAGWVDDDNDTSTPLVCQGCKYAEEVDPSFEGSPLEFELLMGTGSETGEQLGIFFDAQMEEIGIQVDFQTVDFNTVLIPTLDGQTFDMIGLAWSLALPIDPDVTRFYTPAADVPGSGFNFVSMNNPELNELLVEARTVPGCDQEVRAELYAEVQEILHNELPYLYLTAPISLTAVQANVQNFKPTPFSRTWNLDEWIILE